jgi:hypothetical protein
MVAIERGVGLVKVPETAAGVAARASRASEINSLAGIIKIAVGDVTICGSSQRPILY